MLIVTQKGEVLNLSHIGRMWIQATNNGSFQIKADFFRWLDGLVMAEYKTRSFAESEMERLVRTYDDERKKFEFSFEWIQRGE